MLFDARGRHPEDVPPSSALDDIAAALIDEAFADAWEHAGNGADLGHVRDRLQAHDDTRSVDMGLALGPWCPGGASGRLFAGSNVPALDAAFRVFELAELNLLENDGDLVNWDPGKLAARTGEVEVYRADLFELRQGDRIRWTKNDAAYGLVNSQTAEVTGGRTAPCRSNWKTGERSSSRKAIRNWIISIAPGHPWHTRSRAARSIPSSRRWRPTIPT